MFISLFDGRNYSDGRLGSCFVEHPNWWQITNQIVIVILKLLICIIALLVWWRRGWEREIHFKSRVSLFPVLSEFDPGQHQFHMMSLK